MERVAEGCWKLIRRGEGNGGGLGAWRRSPEVDISCRLNVGCRRPMELGEQLMKSVRESVCGILKRRGESKGGGRRSRPRRSREVDMS